MSENIIHISSSPHFTKGLTTQKNYALRSACITS